MKIFSKLLCRILPIDFEQPLLTSNGTFGSDEFAVYRDSSNSGYCYGDAWQAFATESGYDGSHCTGNYGNEYSTTLYFHICMPQETCITSLSFYNVASDTSAYNAYLTYHFYGSQSDGDWTELCSGTATQRTTETNSFTNSTEYKYYMLSVQTPGYGHADMAQVSSIRLNGTYEDFV